MVAVISGTSVALLIVCIGGSSNRAGGIAYSLGQSQIFGAGGTFSKGKDEVLKLHVVDRHIGADCDAGPIYNIDGVLVEILVGDVVWLGANYRVVALYGWAGVGETSKILEGSSWERGKSLRKWGVSSIKDIGSNIDWLKVERIRGDGAEPVVDGSGWGCGNNGVQIDLVIGEDRWEPCDGVPYGESAHGEGSLPGGSLVVELAIVKISVGIHPVVCEGVYFEYGLNDHIVQFYHVYFIGIWSIEISTDTCGCTWAIHHEGHVDDLPYHFVVYLLEGMTEMVGDWGISSTESYCEGQGIESGCPWVIVAAHVESVCS